MSESEKSRDQITNVTEIRNLILPEILIVENRFRLLHKDARSPIPRLTKNDSTPMPQGSPNEDWEPKPNPGRDQ